MYKKMNELKIKKVPMSPLMAHWMCIMCSSGEMKSMGFGGTNNAERWWWHKCNMCGYEDTAQDIYPRMIYEETVHTPHFIDDHEMGQG